MKGWYYKAFGMEVGPVSMENLIDQIKDRALTREDEVRFGDSGLWRRIGSIGSLMAHLPYETPETLDLDNDRRPTNVDQAPKSVSANWYYNSLGLEVGPVSMDRLVELITDRSLSREDEVRFGDDGNWRRVGSIGPLMTHLPFETASMAGPKISMERASPEEVDENDHPNTLLDSLDLNSLDDFEHDELTINHNALSKSSQPVESSASSNSIEERETAKKETAQNGSAPDLWWCTVQGKEYGPIELPKLQEWAATGRLRRDDYVRRGLETYVPANDMPGIFPQLPNAGKLETKASVDTVDQPVISNPVISEPVVKKPRLSKSIDNLPPPVEKVDTTAKAVAKTRKPKPSVEKAPAPPPVVEKTATKTVVSSPVRSSPPNTSARPSFASTPAPVAKAPSYPVAATKSARRPSGIDFGGLMKTLLPIVLGVGGIAVVGVLIYFGSSMISAGGTNTRLNDQFKSLYSAYADFARFRDAGSKSVDELKTAQKKLMDVTSPIVDDLDKIQSRTANQTNLSRLAKKMLQISKEELASTKSKNEMEAETQMKIAANGLGIKL